MLARPVASAIVAERAPWRVKCSVVTKLTAAGCGTPPPSRLVCFSDSLFATPLLPATRGRRSPADGHQYTKVRRLGLSDEALDQGEGTVGDLSPTVVDGEGVAAVISTISVTPSLLLVGGIGDRSRHGFSHFPQMISSGPRSGLSVSAVASVIEVAVAAWNSSFRGRDRIGLEHPSEDVGRMVIERVVQVLEIARNAAPRMHSGGGCC
jgi:hypothetical protein